MQSSFRGYGWIPTLSGDIFLNPPNIPNSLYIPIEEEKAKKFLHRISSDTYERLKTEYHILVKGFSREEQGENVAYIALYGFNKKNHHIYTVHI
jgi:hypothetical protein